MLDQVVWILGRPVKVTSFLRSDARSAAAFEDNTLGVFEFENALAFIDIAALETQPAARRFEVYGSRGSAISGRALRARPAGPLCLSEAGAGYRQGERS